ncbi:unnamed protein product [Adineta ricciae]|uniref:Peptidase S1 domain-containing protein n=1 Tax=Adineta ricciae TaxID=249248 RepID=A0A814G087_ADIRI|nr:unnamed protein product [Adineta ricciae]CAF1423879.1 unnamed protein product [Adineta ricciae]
MQHHLFRHIERPNPSYNVEDLPRKKFTKCSIVGLLLLFIVLGTVLGVAIILAFVTGLQKNGSAPVHLKNVSTDPFDESCLCGCSTIEPVFDNRTKGSGRIINGETVREHSWPWQMLLIIYDLHRQPLTFCGATLITDRHILTAAHCVHQFMPPFIFVFPGQHQLNMSISPSLGYPVTQVFIHERYNVLLQHDLAILTVDQPFRFDSHLRPICLATSKSPLLQTNDELIAIGWGRISAQPGANIYANDLQQVELSYISASHPNCSEIFQPIVGLHPGQMCAGRPKHNACYGDSGGPLMRKILSLHNDSYHWEQVGIASKTIDCGWNSTWPDIYINISYYYNWIMKTIEHTN